MYDKKVLEEVFFQFLEGGHVVAVDACFAGHINQTYIVTHKDYDCKTRRYVMQRLNRAVFPHLVELMENVIRISEHMHQRCHANPAYDPVRGYLHFLRTQQGAHYLDSEEYGFWRMYRYIDHAVGKLIPETERDAYSSGLAFGKFQEMLADLEEPRLHETIPFFHDTRHRFEALEESAQKDVKGRLVNCQDVLDRLRTLREKALEVQVAAEAGKIPERVVHNDAKLSNILLDETDDYAVCVIDLDTCMPGLALHDFGDLMRSICGNLPEDTQAPETMEVRVEMYRALCAGYLKGAGAMLLEDEIALLPESGVALTLELAVRFLKDYLDGDIYFGIKYHNHNLVRAKAQLALGQKLIEALPELHAITDSLR